MMSKLKASLKSLFGIKPKSEKSNAGQSTPASTSATRDISGLAAPQISATGAPQLGVSSRPALPNLTLTSVDPDPGLSDLSKAIEEAGRRAGTEKSATPAHAIEPGASVPATATSDASGKSGSAFSNRSASARFHSAVSENKRNSTSLLAKPGSVSSTQGPTNGFAKAASSSEAKPEPKTTSPDPVTTAAAAAAAAAPAAPETNAAPPPAAPPAAAPPVTTAETKPTGTTTEPATKTDAAIPSTTEAKPVTAATNGAETKDAASTAPPAEARNESVVSTTTDPVMSATSGPLDDHPPF